MATNREHTMQETPKAVISRVMGKHFFTASVTSKNDSNHISLKDLTKLSDLSMSAARRSARARDRKTADNISSNSVLQTEGQSEKIQLLEETVQKLVEMQDKLMQHVCTVVSTGEELKREDKVEESKFSMSSKFYKEGWKATEKLKSNENFKDWLDRLELEVSLVRPKGLYWKQLSGELSYDDMSTEQREMFYERSGDLLLSIKSCLAGTEYVNLIRHVKVDTNCKITGGEEAFRILTKKDTGLRDEVLVSKISNLFMKDKWTIQNYIVLGKEFENELFFKPVLSQEVFVGYWIEGLRGKYISAKSRAKMEVEKLIESGKKWSLEDIAARVVKETTAFGQLAEGEKWFVSGQDLGKLLTDKTRQDQDLVTGTRTMVVEPGAAPAATPAAGQKKNPWTGDACTNKFCESKSSHGTDFCVSYGGKREGQFKEHWGEGFRKSLQEKLDVLIKKHGPSGVSTNASGVSSTEPSMDGRLARIKVDMLHCAKEDTDRTMGFLNNTCAEMSSVANGSRWD
jgi:hypothetical protein